MEKPKRVSIFFYCFAHDHKCSDFDLELIKKQKKQELRKRSHRKASDGMDKDAVVPFVETSEAPEDTT